MALPTEVANNIGNFYTNILPANSKASKNDLIAYFSALGQHQLPFPSTFFPTRLNVNNANLNFLSFGRNQFTELVATLDLKKLSSYRVYGCIGSGKSHLFATYVVYLHCLRLMTNQTCPRVIYISMCRDVGAARMLFQLAHAILIAYDDRIAHDSLLQALNPNNVTVEQLNEHLARLQAQTHERILFIYDDFNYFLDHNNEVEIAMGNTMRFLSVGHRSIEIISYGAVIDELANSNPGNIPRFDVDSALTTAEWAAWRGFPNTPTWATAPVGATAAAMAATVQNDHHVKYMTGWNPLILSQLSSYGVADFTEAVARYMIDHDGGARVRA